MYTSIIEDETTKLSLNQIPCYVVSHSIRKNTSSTPQGKSKNLRSYWRLTPPPTDGATARGGPWPPLQYASRSLGSLLYLSIRLYPSFSGPWTRHPAISFLVFIFVLLHTAFRTASFFGIAVSCILSICPSHRILWHLINLTMFSPLIMASNSSFCRILHNSFSFTGPYIFRKIFLSNNANDLSSSTVSVHDSEP